MGMHCALSPEATSEGSSILDAAHGCQTGPHSHPDFPVGVSQARACGMHLRLDAFGAQRIAWAELQRAESGSKLPFNDEKPFTQDEIFEAARGEIPAGIEGSRFRRACNRSSSSLAWRAQCRAVSSL